MVALQKADTNLDEVVNDVNNLVNCTHCHGPFFFFFFSFLSFLLLLRYERNESRSFLCLQLHKRPNQSRIAGPSMLRRQAPLVTTLCKPEQQTIIARIRRRCLFENQSGLNQSGLNPRLIAPDYRLS